MGGGIAAETAPGRGCRFTVTVPVQLVASAPPEAAPLAAVPPDWRLEQPPASPKREQPSQGLPRRGSLGATFAQPAAGGALLAVPLLPSAVAQPAPRRCRILLVGASSQLARFFRLCWRAETPWQPLPLALPACEDDHALNLRLCKRLLESSSMQARASHPQTPPCSGLPDPEATRTHTRAPFVAQVETADDGDVALEWLCSSYAPESERAPVDLVLMDMQARSFEVHRCMRYPTAMLTRGGVLSHRCRAWTACKPRSASEIGSARSGPSSHDCPSSRSPQMYVC
jgi:CheY-like chemotaxis protein